MDTIITMYITLFVPILAGIVNMIFLKLPLFSCLKKPIDGNLTLKDGNRLFGENKTWKGLFGYVFFHVIFALLWGLISSKVPYLESHNYFYMGRENTVFLNLQIGVLLGLAYSLFELPNSFLKRRIGITPGKTLEGAQKVFFIFLDQADSVFGCAFVVWMFYPIGPWKYLLYVILGSATHIVLNMLLYFLHLRKNMF